MHPLRWTQSLGTGCRARRRATPNDVYDYIRLYPLFADDVGVGDLGGERGPLRSLPGDVPPDDQVLDEEVDADGGDEPPRPQDLQVARVQRRPQQHPRVADDPVVPPEDTLLQVAAPHQLVPFQRVSEQVGTQRAPTDFARVVEVEHKHLHRHKPLERLGGAPGPAGGDKTDVVEAGDDVQPAQLRLRLAGTGLVGALVAHVLHRVKHGSSRHWEK